MTDIIERLREQCPERYKEEQAPDVICGYERERLEAADEIESLRKALEVHAHYAAEVERLRALLAATERDLEKALAALDHHMKADR